MVKYRPGSHYLIPRRWTVGKELVTDILPNDTHPKEFSHRTFVPQKHYFDVNKRHVASTLEFEQRRFEFYEFETRMIWTAFDHPERLGMMFSDYAIRGYKDSFRSEWIDAALHWTKECRFWRCLGIHKPFYDENTLRVNCWANHGADIGRIQFSEAMNDAVMDLERAVKRKAQGLDPNYLWDLWGPVGFVDGRMTDFLPRAKGAEYIDPDGVDVTVEEIAPYCTQDALRERYAEFIFPDPAPYIGVFLVRSSSLSHKVPSRVGTL
jgi:hypothetical protein